MVGRDRAGSVSGLARSLRELGWPKGQHYRNLISVVPTFRSAIGLFLCEAIQVRVAASGD